MLDVAHSTLSREPVVLLEAVDISKRFGGIAALPMCVSSCGGEIHALMGENGAGKST